MLSQKRLRKAIANRTTSNISNSFEHLIRNARATRENGIDVGTIASLLPATRKALNQDETSEIDTQLDLPEWRRASPLMEYMMYQLALSQIENDSDVILVPFVFRLSQPLWAKCKSSPSTSGYLAERFRKNINPIIDGDLLYWFAIEESGNKRHPHIQGSILLQRHKIEQAREAFHKIDRHDDKANGAKLWFRHEKRQRLFQTRGRLAVDLNWASYNVKERSRIAYETIGHQNPAHVSRELERRSKRLYDALRATHRNPHRWHDPHQRGTRSLWGSWQ